jgi:hypothetical protein
MSCLITWTVRGIYLATFQIYFLDLESGLQREIVEQNPQFSETIKKAIAENSMLLYSALSDGVMTSSEISSISEKIARSASLPISIVNEGVVRFASSYPIIIRNFWFYKTIAESIPLWTTLSILLFLLLTLWFYFLATKNSF